MKREIYFFVARQADGTPLFLQQADNLLDKHPLEGLKKSLIQRLDGWRDVDHIALYQVTTDGFELLIFA